MKLLASAFVFAALAAPAWAAPTDVTVDMPMAFPESLTSTPNGTIYIGSLNRGEGILFAAGRILGHDFARVGWIGVARSPARFRRHPFAADKIVIRSHTTFFFYDTGQRMNRT